MKENDDDMWNSRRQSSSFSLFSHSLRSSSLFNLSLSSLYSLCLCQHSSLFQIHVFFPFFSIILWLSVCLSVYVTLFYNLSVCLLSFSVFLSPFFFPTLFPPYVLVSIFNYQFLIFNFIYSSIFYPFFFFYFFPFSSTVLFFQRSARSMAEAAQHTDIVDLIDTYLSETEESEL